jgi:hypothetical protein
MIYRCRVKHGTFNTYPIYKVQGEVKDLAEAAAEAERQFGHNWEEVFTEGGRLRRIDLTLLESVL